MEQTDRKSAVGRRSIAPAWLAQWADRHRDDLEAAGIWLASRAAVFYVAYLATWMLGPYERGLFSLEEQWGHWDADWYRRIAETGYEPPRTVVLPILPMAMRWVGYTGIGPIFAGLLVNLIAGTAAAILIRRLAQTWGYNGRWAVIVLATAPMTVFMTAPYTEALFLAFTLGAWLAAVRGKYWIMGVLASGAVLTRINGVFLVIALAVLLLLQRHFVKGVPWLLLPTAAFGAWTVYLHSFRGDWFEWFTAQQEEWNRGFTGPIGALSKSLVAAIRPCDDPAFCWYAHPEMFLARMELLAGATLIVAAVWLIWKRRWPELTYTALVILVTMNTGAYFCIPRYLLTVWPITLILGGLLARYRTARWLWIVFIAPLAVLWTAMYAVGRWAS